MGTLSASAVGKGVSTMQKLDTRTLVRLAIIAAAYVALTFASMPLAYGMIQFRVSEVLTLLCFYNKRYRYALILGCFIVNLFSPLGWYDVVFGTLATAFAVYFIPKCKNIFVASLFPTLSNIIVGLELYFLFGDASLPVTVGSVMAGEFAVVTVIAVPLFLTLQKRTSFLRLIEADQNLPQGA